MPSFGRRWPAPRCRSTAEGDFSALSRRINEMAHTVNKVYDITAAVGAKLQDLKEQEHQRELAPMTPVPASGTPLQAEPRTPGSAPSTPNAKR